jgi:hypothetical protein
VAKSEAVLAAGGAGMILFNQNDGQTQNTDLHFVPSVHINNTDGLVIKDYIDTASAPVAQINGGVFTPIEAPWMAGFSSRGPNRLSGDIIKPDVTAPGVNILAGHSPVNYEADPQGQLFQAVPGDFRHLDVEPARRRPFCTAEAGASGLDSCHGQVGADDDRLPGRQ